MANQDSSSGPTTIALLEEAVHLLRRHPLELTVYFAGTGPFVVALLYAWARVTWFAPHNGELILGALVLTVLFGAMKVAQHRFAQRLLAHRSGAVVPAWRWREAPALLAAEFRLQATAVFALPLAVLAAVPFGWVYAYYQTATVVRDADSAARRQQAWALTKLWPKQNHLALAILSGLWFMVFLNVAVAFYFVPMLATKLLGLKTLFALSGWSYLNSTLIVLMIGLAQLLVDPLIKAFYVLRVFHGRALHTGADIRLVLLHEKTLRVHALRVAWVLIGFAMLVPAAARAGTAVVSPATPSGPIAPATVALDRAIDRVLERPEFAWRLRPEPPPPSLQQDGPLKGFVRATLRVMQEMGRDIVRAVKKFQRWLSDVLPGGSDPIVEAPNDRGHRSLDWMAALQIGAYILLFIVLGVVLFVGWRVWRFNRLPKEPELASAPAAGAPDLRDESVEASRLPADGWLELARQQIAAGEWRLALRALFLASLAQLAVEGLVTLARFKTNHDYEREVRRRARERGALLEEFRGRRQQFEDTWYGNHPVETERVHDWLRQLEARP